MEPSTPEQWSRLYVEGMVHILPDGRRARLVKISPVDQIIAGLATPRLVQHVNFTRPFNPFEDLRGADSKAEIEFMRTVTMLSQIDPPIVEGSDPPPGCVGTNTLSLVNMRYITAYALEETLPEVQDAPFLATPAAEAGDVSGPVASGADVGTGTIGPADPEPDRSDRPDALVALGL